VPCRACRISIHGRGAVVQATRRRGEPPRSLAIIRGIGGGAQAWGTCVGALALRESEGIKRRLNDERRDAENAERAERSRGSYPPSLSGLGVPGSASSALALRPGMPNSRARNAQRSAASSVTFAVGVGHPDAVVVVHLVALARRRVRRPGVSGRGGKRELRDPLAVVHTGVSLGAGSPCVPQPGYSGRPRAIPPIRRG